MEIPFVDLKAQYASIKGEIDQAISDVIASSAFIGGPFVKAFESSFAAFSGAKHCIGVGNGTDALEIALEGLAFSPGSEVLVPANSFIASAEAVTRAGLRVVFCDCDPYSYTISLEDAARRVTPRTRAVIPVHLYGQACDMDGVRDLASINGLKVIEDCAQAHGAEYKGSSVGGIGDVGAFSFYPGKNLGAYGDGGAIVTNDDELAKKYRMIANHGRIEKYNHEFEGRNSRLDGLQAAILTVKLSHLDSWIDKRNQIAQRYLQQLAGIKEITLPAIQLGARHSFHLFVIRTVHRDALARHLSGVGVQTGIHYPIALPKLAAYAYLGQSAEPMVALRQDAELLSLPMGEHLNLQDVDLIVHAIKSFFGNGEPGTKA